MSIHALLRDANLPKWNLLPLCGVSPRLTRATTSISCLSAMTAASANVSVRVRVKILRGAETELSIYPDALVRDLRQRLKVCGSGFMCGCYVHVCARVGNSIE